MEEVTDWVADCEEWDPDFKELNRATEVKPFSVMEELAAYRGKTLIELWRERHWSALLSRRRRKAEGAPTSRLETVTEEATSPPKGDRPKRKPRKRKRRGRKRVRKDVVKARGCLYPGLDEWWRLGELIVDLYTPVLKLYLGNGIKLACFGSGRNKTGKTGIQRKKVKGTKRPPILPGARSPEKLSAPRMPGRPTGRRPPPHLPRFVSLPVLRKPPPRPSRRMVRPRRPKIEQRLVESEDIKKTNKRKHRIFKDLKGIFKNLICWKKED